MGCYNEYQTKLLHRQVHTVHTIVDGLYLAEWSSDHPHLWVASQSYIDVLLNSNSNYNINNFINHPSSSSWQLHGTCSKSQGFDIHYSAVLNSWILFLATKTCMPTLVC